MVHDETTGTTFPHDASARDAQYKATPKQSAIASSIAESDTLDLDGLSRLLHRSRATILTDRCRNPDRVPPACTPPGARYPLWIRADVLAWLREHPDPRHSHPHGGTHVPHRRPGRPTKQETVRHTRGDA